MTNPRPTSLLTLSLALMLAATTYLSPTSAAPIAQNQTYKVLTPIQSGDLTLFPVVATTSQSNKPDPFLTLDEGLRTNEVEVTEAGRVRGLVRSRGGAAQSTIYRSDQVNTLVLVNHSTRPLLLLAGEIVTGGKQDRIIAKDRIVPPGADPIDLSVFCIEHGRWTESPDREGKFGTTAPSPAKSFMVQPAVRQQAMAARSQQQVWDSVSTSINAMVAKAAAPPPISAGAVHGATTAQIRRPDVFVQGNQAIPAPATTSYAKALQSAPLSAAVDEASSNLAQSREHILTQLRQQHAIGVVVAVHGEIIWADLFSDTDLLTRYWTKLIRSYAAESLTTVSQHASATQSDAQRFLNQPLHGAENSEGEAGVYRYSEIRMGLTDQFALESLLPNTAAEVHISRLKLKNVTDRRPVLMY